MKTRNKNKILFLLLILSLLLKVTGCFSINKSVPPDGKNNSRSATDSSVAQRFQPSQQKTTAVDSAIELSEKYAELSMQATELRGNNTKLAAENIRLKDNNTKLKAQLKQTDKELEEANALLIKMSVELNNWKVDVLGFRDEMRSAQKAQLQALHKILIALGGEITQDVNSPTEADSNPPDTEKR